MDPLSVAGAVLGLISSASKMIPMLYNLGTSIKDAPQQAQAAVSELGDITVILTQLQTYIDGRAQASIERLQLITVEHIATSLTGCVITFSELDALLKSLQLDKGLRGWNRAVWLVKKDQVEMLTGRLQNHKSTLGMMLNIIQCATIAEAERSMDKLCDTVNKVLQSNLELSLRLRNMEDIYAGRAAAAQPSSINPEIPTTVGAEQQMNSLALENDDGVISSKLTKSDATQIPLESDAELEKNEPKTSAFEELLHRSRVYRHAKGRHAISSLDEDDRSSLAFSICSSMTLGEVSNISVFAIPIYAFELSNPDCYKSGRPAASMQKQEAVAKTGQGPRPAPQQRVTDDLNEKRLKLEQKRNLSTWWSNFKRAEAQSTQLPKVQDTEGKRIFGVPLTSSLPYANVPISLGPYIYGWLPIVVAKCCVFLKDNATDTENIFATAGSPKNIGIIESAFDTAPRYGRRFDWAGYTVYDASSVLLRYLLTLPEPVIPLDFYERFRDPLRNHQAQAVGEFEGQRPCVGNPDGHKAIEQYRILLTELNPMHKDLLLYLFDFCAVFASKAFINKMTTPWLAAIFQPGILHHPQHAFPESRLSQDALIFLIEYQHHFLIGRQGITANVEE